MIRPFAILIASAVALSIAIGTNAFSARATVLEMPQVNDEAVLSGFPRTLDAYRFFNPDRAQIPNGNVYPYRLNTALYSDGAEKLRFAYIPQGKTIEAGEDGLLQFPVGSALIKTFAFGEGEGRRLIETRVLLHRADGWVALPYRWNDEQSEANLALAGGRLEVTAPAGEAISYRIPNKNQCKECHGLNDAVIPLGPKARNLSAEWLSEMVQVGRLDALPEGADAMPVWEDRDEAAVSVAARAYLDVNCAHCHRPGATASNSGLDLRWEQATPQAIGIHKRPVAAGRGAGGLEFSIVPGNPDQSILLYRMASLEPGVAMPELGKATVDAEGVAIVRQWIGEMGE